MCPCHLSYVKSCGPEDVLRPQSYRPAVQKKWEAAEASKEVPRPVPRPPPGMCATSAELPKGDEAVNMFNRVMSDYWSQVWSSKEPRGEAGTARPSLDQAPSANVRVA